MIKSIKNLLLVIVLLCISNTSQAWWKEHVNVTTDKTVIIATVINQYNRAIYCEGYVFGRTYYGNILNNWAEGIIDVGNYSIIFVNTNTNDPFVEGWTNIQCRWQ